MHEALKCYRNKKLCKKQFKLNTSEYNYLISEMLQIVKLQKSAPTQAPLNVQSFETGSGNYVALDNFNTPILPNSYAPITSTRQLSKQFQEKGMPAGLLHNTVPTVQPHQPHQNNASGVQWHQQLQLQQPQQTQQPYSPMQAANMCDDQNQLTNLKNHNDTNQNLLDRRFFSLIPNQDTPLPPRYGTSNQNSVSRQPGQTIFNRTFDLQRECVPNITADRQSVGCRRANNV